MKRRYISQIIEPNSAGPLIGMLSTRPPPTPAISRPRTIAAITTGRTTTSGMKMVLPDRSIRDSERSKMRRRDDRNDGIGRRTGPDADAGAGEKVDDTAGASGLLITASPDRRRRPAGCRPAR